MNLADTYAFTGTVSGAGSLVKLLASTSSSEVSNFDVDSTYINSTYDNYRIIAGYTHPVDNVYAYIRFFVGGTIKEADYKYENAAGTSSTYSYDAYDATAMSVGVAGVLIETHNNPNKAPSDGPCMLPLKDLQILLEKLIEIDFVTKNN